VDKLRWLATSFLRGGYTSPVHLICVISVTNFFSYFKKI